LVVAVGGMSENSCARKPDDFTASSAWKIHHGKATGSRGQAKFDGSIV
jgi:hypothetical protein